MARCSSLAAGPLRALAGGAAGGRPCQGGGRGREAAVWRQHPRPRLQSGSARRLIATARRKFGEPFLATLPTDNPAVCGPGGCVCARQQQRAQLQPTALYTTRGAPGFCTWHANKQTNNNTILTTSLRVLTVCGWRGQSPTAAGRMSSLAAWRLRSNALAPLMGGGGRPSALVREGEEGCPSVWRPESCYV